MLQNRNLKLEIFQIFYWQFYGAFAPERTEFSRMFPLRYEEVSLTLGRSDGPISIHLWDLKSFLIVWMRYKYPKLCRALPLWSTPSIIPRPNFSTLFPITNHSFTIYNEQIWAHFLPFFFVLFYVYATQKLWEVLIYISTSDLVEATIDCRCRI